MRIPIHAEYLKMQSTCTYIGGILYRTSYLNIDTPGHCVRGRPSRVYKFDLKFQIQRHARLRFEN